MKRLIQALFLFSGFLCSCGSPMAESDLHGRWKYLEVSNPEQRPVHVQRGEELEAQDPSVTFSEDGRLLMIWGGKTLSQGTFKVEFPNIVYQEKMPDGKSRIIRFLVKKFEKDTLVFQTQEADPVRVKAIRLK